MTIHTEPNINGMGAFEGVSSGILWRQKIVRNAKIALADLDDETLALVVTEELRRRPAMLANRIVNEVTK